MEKIKITNGIEIEWDSEKLDVNHTAEGKNNRRYIGKYTVIRELGHGGEGCVYLARDEDLQRIVAIKEVNRNRQDSEAEKQLLKEADILQQLRHPMLPVIYDLLWENAWYLVMEYIQGTTLSEYIDRNGYVQAERAYAWAEQLMDILLYLHTRKPSVIYRDLKPDNIMVCPDGRLKLVDFGAAYKRNFGSVLDHSMAATLGYAAPEQLGRLLNHGGQAGGVKADYAVQRAYADERSDIYALGKVLYYIVTGADPAKPPYASRSIRDYQPLLPDRLERLIRKCIRDDPSERYQVVTDIRKDLERCRSRKQRLRRRGFIKVIEKQVWLTEG